MRTDEHILGEVQQCNPHCLVECRDAKADSARDITKEASICLKKQHVTSSCQTNLVESKAQYIPLYNSFFFLSV